MNAPNPEPAGSPVTGSPEKKPRNSTERTIVWGGIAVLLAIMLLELRAQQGYARTLEALGNAVESDDANVTVEHAKSLLAFSPSVTEMVQGSSAQGIKCSWLSLFKNGQYEIVLAFSQDKEPTLLGFTTPSFPEEAEPQPTASETASIAHGPGEPGGMGMGGGGMGPGMGMGGMGMGGPGGMRRPNPLREALDTDADGSLSAEEIAGAATGLAKLDKDSDGQIVAGELAPPAPASPPASEGHAANPPAGDASAPAPAGPPGGGGPGAGGPGSGGRRFPNRLLESIDSNSDGTISAEERAAASEGLKKLDLDGDGKIIREELRPPGGPGGGGPGGPGGGRGAGEGGERRRRPDAEGSTPEAPPTNGPSVPAASESPAQEPPKAP